MKSFNRKTGWAAGKCSTPRWCIWLQNLLLWENVERTHHMGHSKAQEQQIQHSSLGKAWRKSISRKGSLAESQRNCSFVALGRQLQSGQRKTKRSSEYLSRSEPSLHCPTLAGGHCMATGAKWPNPAHSCLSNPTLTALSEAFFEV